MSATGTGQVLIEVHTNKRSYTCPGDAQVIWLPGEKVVSMEVVDVEP